MGWKTFNRLVAVWFVCSLCITLSQGCPSECDCSDIFSIKCIGLNLFPEDLPPEAENITFEDCNFTIIQKLPLYENVETLSIVQSLVTNITDSPFKTLPQLKSLNLRNNRLRDIRKDMFMGLKILMELVLDYNYITKFPDQMFSAVPKIQILSLEGNKNLQLSETSIQGWQLNKLNLNDCNFSLIPSEAFIHGESIQTLYCGGNPLKKIEKGAFKDLVNLKNLHIPNCMLTSIDDDAFDDLRLEELNLADNQLEELDKDVFDDLEDTLHTLDLENNKFKSLHYELINTEKVKSLKLEGNPWNCDCYVYWMRNAHIHGNVTCSSPEMLLGEDIRNVTASMECPCKEGFCENRKLAILVIVPILIVCFILIIYYVVKLCKKRQRSRKMSQRYSAVYRDVTKPA